MAILWVRNDPVTGQGIELLAWILALVIAADTGAYTAGRSIGGPKLAPRISAPTRPGPDCSARWLPQPAIVGLITAW